MSTIQVLELNSVGSNLFQDSESFLQELHDREIALIQGGVVVSQVTVTAAYQVLDNNNLSLLAARTGSPESSSLQTMSMGDWEQLLRSIFSQPLL